MNRKTPTIYLVQTRHCIEMERPIYKLGRTNRPMKERLNGYPKGTEERISCFCVDSTKCEDILLTLFKKKYIQRKDYGSEYFEGDCESMKRDIQRICREDKDENGDEDCNESEGETDVVDTYQKLRQNSDIVCIIITHKNSFAGYVKYNDSQPGYAFGDSKKYAVSLRNIIEQNIKTECYDIDEIISDICDKTYDNKPKIHVLKSAEYPVFIKRKCYILDLSDWKLTLIDSLPELYFSNSRDLFWPSYYDPRGIDVGKIISSLVINPHIVNNYKLLCRRVLLGEEKTTHFTDYYSDVPYLSNWLMNALEKFHNDKFTIRKSKNKEIIEELPNRAIRCILITNKDKVSLTEEENRLNIITKVRNPIQSPYNVESYTNMLKSLKLNDFSLFQSIPNGFWDYIRFIVS
jgi:hypothetical protein